ncbi:MAG: tetratricopeptide repeat protein [Anaerovoracaceae bacterium]|jgi:tetratricopeptide (TPR) repeat protein
MNKSKVKKDQFSVLPPFESREDRIGQYFHKYLKEYIFDELSPEFLERAGKLKFMKGIPVPFHKKDIEAFKDGTGLKVLDIAENMLWIMGIDPKFKYVPQYIKYISHFFNDKIVDNIVKEGQNAVEKGDVDRGTIFFRVALILEPDNIHAMYSYAGVCREHYLNSTNGEYIGRFKAESIEYFELLTQVHPEFAEAYYYLGYDYLNMGLYQKAALTWQEYLQKGINAKEKNEIEQRMEQLKDPIEIEKACNSVLTGRFEEAIQTLEPYLETDYKEWWPLYYYLGVSYSGTGRNNLALDSFKQVLSINPAHGESMLELAHLYRQNGDKENEKKYRKKAELVLNKEQGIKQVSRKEENRDERTIDRK